MGISTGYWLSRCLHVAADLGVADALGDGPESAAGLAMLSGRQRTLREHERLLGGVGFRLEREIDCGSFSILEATPA